MAGYQIKRMNWGRTLSAYESMQAWRERRQAAQEKFEANAAATLTSLQAVWENRTFMLGELAANAALKRIEEETKAAQERALALKADEEIVIDPPKQSSFSYTDTVTLSGGAVINLAANTITHTDGTVVDLTTGAPVPTVDIEA
jgi:hypothetical protein